MKGSVDFATKSLILSFLLVLLVADPSGACTVSLTAQKIDEAGALKCLSCKETADVGAWKWVIRHSTYHCSSSPAKACALAEDPSGVVTGTDVILFPYGFDNQSPSECGCLQANILHEAFHNLLRDGGYAEKEIDERVKKCFSCGQNP